MKPQEFIVSASSLAGALPDALGCMLKMQRLKMKMNQQRGSIPATVAFMARLQELHLGLRLCACPYTDIALVIRAEV